MNSPTKFLKNIWNWLGKQENSNALTIILASIAVLLALPYFSKQINNIQIKVDSIETNIQKLYDHYNREIFTYDQIKNGIKPAKDGTLVTIHLKSKPIPNSVNVWWGVMYLSPTDYSVIDNTVTIHFTPQTPDEIADPKNETPFVVAYVENGQ